MGDAGGIATNDTALADWMRLLPGTEVRGAPNRGNYRPMAYRLNLKAKLPHLQRWTAKRQAAAKIYNELFEGLDEVITPPTIKALSMFTTFT